MPLSRAFLAQAAISSTRTGGIGAVIENQRSIARTAKFPRPVPAAGYRTGETSAADGGYDQKPAIPVRSDCPCDAFKAARQSLPAGRQNIVRKKGTGRIAVFDGIAGDDGDQIQLGHHKDKLPVGAEGIIRCDFRR